MVMGYTSSSHIGQQINSSQDECCLKPFPSCYYSTALRNINGATFLLSSKLVTGAGKSYCPCDPGQWWGQDYRIWLHAQLLWQVTETRGWEQQWNLLYCCLNCSVFLLDLWKMLAQPPQLSSNMVEERRNKNSSGMCLDPNWKKKPYRIKWDISSTNIDLWVGVASQSRVNQCRLKFLYNFQDLRNV